MEDEYAADPVATRTRRRPSARLCGLLVAALVLLAGCQVRTDVDLTVLPDGSGTVTATVALDAEAAARIPDLAGQLRTADLRKAGWTITGPVPAPGGGVTVTAQKRFARAADAGRVLSELTGPTGPLRDFSVTRTHSFASTSYGVKGTIDLSRGLASFGDAELTRLLDGKPLGRTPDELKLLLGGRPLADAAPFSLRVHLPGVARTYAARVGDPPVPVDSHRSITRTTPWLLAAGALAAFVLAIVVFVDGRRRPNRRLRRPSERGTGTYDRRPYQTIDTVGDGPVPGVGGLPSEVRIHPIDALVPPPEPPVPPPPVARRPTPADPAARPAAVPSSAGPRPDPRR
ncbi:MAG: hypothetical protein JWN46_1314, partial [Acidimicrobiales bacterium]|nr:hypothetical protein [Acidimicrobiales bacterium]